MRRGGVEQDEITWNEVSGATHYKLYRSTTSGGLYTRIGGDISVTRYRDDELSVKTAYYYRLEACNIGGCSGQSPEVSIAGGSLGAGRDEISSDLNLFGITFFGGRAYVEEASIGVILSYAVEADGVLSGARFGTFAPIPNLLGVGDIAFSGERIYVAVRAPAKIISFEVDVNGSLSAARDEITTGLNFPLAIEFSGGRAYVANYDLSGNEDKIISYAVGEDGRLSAARDEITVGLSVPSALAFSGGRAYVADGRLDKIISYAVGEDGRLGATRDEITTGLSGPIAISFAGGRAYVADLNLGKIISYSVGADGVLGAGRDEITAGLSSPSAIAFSRGRAYVVDSGIGKIISYPLLLPPVAPDAPRGVEQDEITWNEISGATHYKLYRSTTSGGLYTRIGGDISVTSYRDDELSVSIYYYYRLEACNIGGCSGQSPEVSIAGGSLGAARDEITTGLFFPNAIVFSGGRAYVADSLFGKIISYAVEADGGLGVARDEITGFSLGPRDIAFSGGRAYAVDSIRDKIISYAVGADGVLGAGRDEITTGLSSPRAIAFSDGRAYVADSHLDKIISYAVGADGVLGAGRNEDNDWFVYAARPRVFRRSGLCGGFPPR